MSEETPRGAIFEEQLDGWYRVAELWQRDRNITTCRGWFEYPFHTMPMDLADEPLLWETFERAPAVMPGED